MSTSTRVKQAQISSWRHDNLVTEESNDGGENKRETKQEIKQD